MSVQGVESGRIEIGKRSACPTTAAITPACREASFPSAGCLEQEPGPTFGFIDPDLDQTCRGHVTILIAHVVRLAKSRDQSFVVIDQLREHVQRFDVLSIIIEHALSARDVTDRSQRKSA